jgi:hypothetical protein
MDRHGEARIFATLHEALAVVGGAEPVEPEEL